MSAAVQGVVVDAVVAVAALWLLWSFGPESWRARLSGLRAKPGHDRALQAEALDGRPPETSAGKPRDGKGCGPARVRLGAPRLHAPGALARP